MTRPVIALGENDYVAMMREIDGSGAKPTFMGLDLASGPSLWGVELRCSPLFPIETRCPVCGGSGEGETSTYCPPGQGSGVTGARRTIGAITDARGLKPIIEPVPRKFEPRVAFRVALPPISRGPL